MKSTIPSEAAAHPFDRLQGLLQHFRVRADLFHAGPLCGVTHFAAEPGRGFLHVLRRGEMVVTHRPRRAASRRIAVAEPALLFYPRALAHDFHNAPAEGSDFVCASVAWEGGDQHPLARALPPLVLLPLRALPELQHTLTLLFAEAGQVRCGRRLMADRLFEVLLLQLLRWLLDHPGEGGVPCGLLTGLAHPKLARALVAMHERPGDAWSLDRLAGTAGMSRSAFAACFREHVGEPPAAYLASWRLSLARERLRAGQPLKRVAEELGYTPNALSRAFAQALGVSPRAWLQSAASGGDHSPRSRPDAA